MRAWHARCCGAPDRRSHVIPDRRSSRRSAVPRYLSGYATTVLLAVSEPTGFVAQKLMKTAGRENQKRCATVRSVPRSRNGRPKQSWSTRWAGSQEKIRPQEKCFSRDSFYRTYQQLAQRKPSVAIYGVVYRVETFLLRIVERSQPDHLLRRRSFQGPPSA